MTARPSGLAPLKTGEYDKLLRQWGFEPIDHGGNHPMYLAPNGITRFPISTPGKVTQRELRQASKIVGVSRRAFLAGPPKNRPIRTVKVEDDLIEKAQAHLDEQVRLAEQRAKEKQMAKVIDTPKRVGRPPDPDSIRGRIRQLFMDSPNRYFTTTEISEKLGCSVKQAADAVFVMRSAGFIHRDDAAGAYCLATAKPEARPARKPQSSPRNGNLRNEILALLEANEGRPMSVDMVVDKLGSVRSSTGNALLQLSRAGAIELLTRGIYRFKMPEHEASSVSDETPEGFAPQDSEPIDLYPTPNERWGRELDQIEAGMAATPQSTLWEQMQDLGDHRYLLRDENGQLWVARMQELNV
jgi:hypothetical protein